MKILGLDSSGLVASVAIVENDLLLAEYTTDYKKTHSQTLLPMLDELRNMIELDMNTVDAIAIASGPGSFAGLLTLSVLSVSMCCKLYIGALDAMDLRAVHALEAMGCGRLAVLRRGVWPQAKASMLSAALYRFDVNLREAAVLGLVGAGGLGTPLLFAMNGYLWSQAAAYLLGLLVLVLAAGAMADRTRRRLG